MNERILVFKVKVIFLPLAQGHLHMKIKTVFSKKTTGSFLTKFRMLDFRYMEMKVIT